MTPRQIFSAAYARSKRNKGASDVDETIEGLRVVQFALDRLYTVIARLLPEYFMQSIQVAVNAGVWLTPVRAESVIRIERQSGEEIGIVPFDDRKLYAGRKPAVYFAARGYKSAGNLNDPVAEPLSFFFAPGAPLVVIDADIPETQWPSQFNGLLVDECAVYLSLKDVRVGEDFPALKDDRDAQARLLVAHLDHVNRNVIHRTGTSPRIVTANIPDVLTLLAGNGRVD